LGRGGFLALGAGWTTLYYAGACKQSLTNTLTKSFYARIPQPVV